MCVCAYYTTTTSLCDICLSICGTLSLETWFFGQLVKFWANFVANFFHPKSFLIPHFAFLVLPSILSTFQILAKLFLLSKCTHQTMHTSLLVLQLWVKQGTTQCCQTFWFWHILGNCGVVFTTLEKNSFDVCFEIVLFNFSHKELLWYSVGTAKMDDRGSAHT